MQQKTESIVIAQQTLVRLPYYVRSLTAMKARGLTHVSAPMLAKELQLGEVQVRKDLSAVSAGGGKPKLGFSIEELLKGMRSMLGCDNGDDAVLVGAGDLGRALMGYKGFDEYGVKILAAFDNNHALAGLNFSGKPVYPMEKMAELCNRLQVHMGIIAVPPDAAQKVCDALVESGILAIWNFAPVKLSAPEGVLVQNENLAASLAILSNRLHQRLS